MGQRILCIIIHHTGSQSPSRKTSPIIGVVVELPAMNVYHATVDTDSYCNGEKIHVSSNKELIHSLLVTGFGYEHGSNWEKNMRLFQEFTDITQGVRRLGAAAVDLCHVACGKVDGFWEFDPNRGTYQLEF